MQDSRVPSLGQEGPLEEEMATHKSIVAWEIPWTEEPGGLQSDGAKRAGHDLVTKQQHIQSVAAVLTLLHLSIGKASSVSSNS